MNRTALNDYPPGPRLPRVIQTLTWIRRPLPFMERCNRLYGDTFTLRIQNEGAWVFLSNPEDVKRVFTGDPAILRAGEANAVLEPVVGSRSVLLLDEPEHMTQRKLMLPPFHGERMQSYRELMVEVTQREIERWPVGEPLALWPRMQAITLEIILRAVFGITGADHTAHLRDLLRRMLDWTTDRRRLAMMAMLGPDRIRRTQSFRALMDPIDQALLGEIAHRRNARDLERRQDILSMLVAARYEDGRPMSDAELRDELITLLVAGHETTATSLAWALERLLRHPAKLGRLREEAQRRRGELSGRGHQGDVAPASGASDRGAPAGRADALRRLRGAGRSLGGALHLPDAPSRGHLPTGSELSAGALPG